MFKPELSGLGKQKNGDSVVIQIKNQNEMRRNYVFTVSGKTIESRARPFDPIQFFRDQSRNRVVRGPNAIEKSPSLVNLEYGIINNPAPLNTSGVSSGPRGVMSRPLKTREGNNTVENYSKHFPTSLNNNSDGVDSNCNYAYYSNTVNNGDYSNSNNDITNNMDLNNINYRGPRNANKCHKSAFSTATTLVQSPGLSKREFLFNSAEISKLSAGEVIKNNPVRVYIDGARLFPDHAIDSVSDPATPENISEQNGYCSVTDINNNYNNLHMSSMKTSNNKSNISVNRRFLKEPRERTFTRVMPMLYGMDELASQSAEPAEEAKATRNRMHRPSSVLFKSNTLTPTLNNDNFLSVPTDARSFTSPSHLAHQDGYSCDTTIGDAEIANRPSSGCGTRRPASEMASLRRYIQEQEAINAENRTSSLGFEPLLPPKPSTSIGSARKGLASDQVNGNNNSSRNYGRIKAGGEKSTAAGVQPPRPTTMADTRVYHNDFKAHTGLNDTSELSRSVDLKYTVKVPKVQDEALQIQKYGNFGNNSSAKGSIKNVQEQNKILYNILDSIIKEKSYPTQPPCNNNSSNSGSSSNSSKNEAGSGVISDNTTNNNSNNINASSVINDKNNLSSNPTPDYHVQGSSLRYESHQSTANITPQDVLSNALRSDYDQKKYTTELTLKQIFCVFAQLLPKTLKIIAQDKPALINLFNELAGAIVRLSPYYAGKQLQKDIIPTANNISVDNILEPNDPVDEKSIYSLNASFISGCGSNDNISNHTASNFGGATLSADVSLRPTSAPAARSPILALGVVNNDKSGSLTEVTEQLSDIAQLVAIREVENEASRQKVAQLKDEIASLEKTLKLLNEDFFVTGILLDEYRRKMNSITKSRSQDQSYVANRSEASKSPVFRNTRNLSKAAVLKFITNK